MPEIPLTLLLERIWPPERYSRVHRIVDADGERMCLLAALYTHFGGEWGEGHYYPDDDETLWNQPPDWYRVLTERAGLSESIIAYLALLDDNFGRDTALEALRTWEMTECRHDVGAED